MSRGPLRRALLAQPLSLGFWGQTQPHSSHSCSGKQRWPVRASVTGSRQGRQMGTCAWFPANSFHFGNTEKMPDLGWQSHCHCPDPRLLNGTCTAPHFGRAPSRLMRHCQRGGAGGGAPAFGSGRKGEGCGKPEKPGFAPHVCHRLAVWSRRCSADLQVGTACGTGSTMSAHVSMV